VFKGWQVITHSRIETKKLLSIYTRTTAYPILQFGLICTSLVTSFRENLVLSADDILSLCFGETSFDKGADLAVKALSELKYKFNLIIAGKEEALCFKMQTELANSSNCEKRLHLFNGGYFWR
jgi:hypothetical protein